MNYFFQSLAKRVFIITVMASLVVAMPAAAADPSYIFNLVEDGQPELCTHMKTIFNTYFQHMWTDRTTTTSLDEKYSATSEYAFPLLPDTSHDTRATLTMRRSKIPSSPEFDAIKWYEGHAVFGGRAGGSTDINNNYLLPYLIAYVDIDNDGILDTVIKEGFSKGYAWILFKGEADPESSETLVTYRDTKLIPPTPTTLSDLIFGSEKSSKPIWLGAGYLRPFIFQGKTYVASYSQGSDETRTKQSRANIKKGIPPHEQMFIFSYTYNGVIDEAGKPQWTQKTLCAFDMLQNMSNH